MHELDAVGQLRGPGDEQRLERVAGRANVVEELFDDDHAVGGVEGPAVRNLEVVLASHGRRPLGLRRAESGGENEHGGISDSSHGGGSSNQVGTVP